jgi:hypothetical protein
MGGMGKAGLLVCVTVAVAVNGSAAQRSGGVAPFAPPVAIDVGGRSGDIALADVNRDGRADLLVPRGLEESAAVYFGDGRGAFAPGEAAVMLPVGSGAVTLGDVNGDRVPDMLVAHRSEGREYLSVMLGDGRGRFRTATSSYVTGSAFAFYKPVIRIADINEDGRPDIVSANGRRNSLEILFGDGRGAFTMGPHVMLEAGDFHTFGIADMDGDGHLDVVSSSQGPGLDRVGLRRGNGTGRFADRVALPSPRPDARVIALADVTGDPRAEVILAHAETSWLSVLVNAGSGTFSPAAGSPYALPADAFEAAVTDLNDDRHADLILTVVDSRTTPYNSNVVILQGDGHGFAPAPGSPISVGRGAYNLAAGDVNGDGKLDVATSSFAGDPVTLLLAR